MKYCKSYCEEKGISTSKLNEAQKALYYIAENMKMQKSISKEGYKYFQKAITLLGIFENDISENLTNGDMIKALFPNGTNIDRSTAYAKRVTENWLNASYKIPEIIKENEVSKDIEEDIEEDEERA